MSTHLLSQRDIDRIHAKVSPDFRRRRILLTSAHLIVLALSIAIIVFISYDTFKNIPFLENETYMTFQFWVCIIFLAEFFLELFLTDNRRQFMRYHWFFLLISIPYLNMIAMLDLQFDPQTLYYIRFIPLIRGAYAMAMVVGYFSSDKAISVIAQYAVILISIIYFSSLIFYYVEKDINSDVDTYWDSLYWACMNVDTVGSYINAVSVVGKILSIILALSGMMMLPLFTVYITAKVQQYNERHRHNTETLLRTLGKADTAPDSSTTSPAAQTTITQNTPDSK